MKNYRIDPNRYYSVQDISRMHLFDWIAKDRKTVMKWIKFDLKTLDILKTVVVPGVSKQGTRYLIRGENIIKYRHTFNG